MTKPKSKGPSCERAVSVRHGSNGFIGSLDEPPNGVGAFWRLFLLIACSAVFALPQRVDATCDKIYWADTTTGKVQRSSLVGTSVEDVVTGINNPQGVRIVGEKVYFTSFGDGKVQRADKDGLNQNVEDVLTGQATVRGVAVDEADNRIYWSVSGSIERADLSPPGANQANVVASPDVVNPSTLRLDLITGKIYWADSPGGNVQRADLDGANLEELVASPDTAGPAHIALDLLNGKMYWAKQGGSPRFIQRADVDGMNLQNQQNLSDPQGAAVDPAGGKVYWTDQGTQKIQRADLDGTNSEDLVTTGLSNPGPIDLDLCGAVTTTTTTSTTTTLPVDHYVAYKGKEGLSLGKGWNVQLDDTRLANGDMDDPENYEIKKAKSLLNPAMKNLESGPARPDLHYVRYQIKEAKEGVGVVLASGDFPKAEKHVNRNWTLTNQFGDIVVESSKVSALLAPTATLSGASPSDLPPPALPGDDTHYKCYRVKAVKEQDTAQVPTGKFRKDLDHFFQVQEPAFDDCLGDTFVGDNNAALQNKCLYNLKKVREFCSPVIKADVEAPRETNAPPGMMSTPNTDKCLLCYRLKLGNKANGAEAATLLGVTPETNVSPKQSKHTGTRVLFTISNQFDGPERMSKTKAELVCVPTDVMSVEVAP